MWVVGAVPALVLLFSRGVLLLLWGVFSSRSLETSLLPPVLPRDCRSLALDVVM